MNPPPSFGSLTDQQVVALALEGQEAAQRELVRRYERPLFSLIYRMVRDRDLAEDLAQESFVKAFNALDRYRPEFKFSGWIFRIANNTAIDHLRKRELKTLSIEGDRDALTADQQTATAIQLPSHHPSPEQELVARELGSVIESAIGRLRPDYRSCILLRFTEQRSYEEIAEIMDLPVGTVKTFIHRARSELMLALKEERK
jgi:RNA polymerase sigma-70 factor (ECF subfamily)